MLQEIFLWLRKTFLQMVFVLVCFSLVPADIFLPSQLLGFHDAVLDIDSVGTFTMCHAALHHLKAGGTGKDATEFGLIVNISATLQYSAQWYQVHVSAAKVDFSLYIHLWQFHYYPHTIQCWFCFLHG